jgi:Ala-tRNA(Pro) deacylase
MKAMTIFARICSFLDEQHLPYMHLTHDFVHRSEEAAKIRGSRFEEAAKALVCRAENNNTTWLIMAVVPGPAKMSYNLLKKEIGAKKLCLASPEEVLKATGLTIGSVPPFGNLWQMPVYVERNLLNEEFMVFSAGSHYDSIRLKVQDYLTAVPHVLLAFGKE